MLFDILEVWLEVFLTPLVVRQRTIIAPSSTAAKILAVWLEVCVVLLRQIAEFFGGSHQNVSGYTENIPFLNMK